MAKCLALVLTNLIGAGALAFSAAAAVPEPPASPTTLQSLQSGLADRLEEAARNLQPDGDRLKGARALDAARRLARVEESLVGCPQAASSAALKSIEAARSALQNGRAADAARLLSQATQTSAPMAQTDCQAQASAVGKLVVNRRGDRIGRLVSLTPGGAAILKTGGAINWFGFLDFGNERRTVPAARLVEGGRMVFLLEG